MIKNPFSKNTVEAFPVPKTSTKIIYPRNIIQGFLTKPENKTLSETMQELIKKLYSEKKEQMKFKFGDLSNNNRNKSRNKTRNNKNRNKSHIRHSETANSTCNTNNKSQRPNRGSRKSMYQKIGEKCDSSSAIPLKKRYTEIEKARIEQIGANVGQWLQNKAKDNDTVNNFIKEVKLKLFALTPQTYEEIKSDFLIKQKLTENDSELLKRFMVVILERAWSQPKFTNLYANLCQELANINPGFKKEVVKTVSNEYYEGFSDFFDLIIDLETSEKFKYTEEKFEKYLKRKNKLLGNMS